MDFLSNTKINFMALKKAGFALSSILAIGSILMLMLGINLGIDFKGGKNLIGTFYHPEIVVIDTNFLLTLSKEEITSGLFEAIK